MFSSISKQYSHPVCTLEELLALVTQYNHSFLSILAVKRSLPNVQWKNRLQSKPEATGRYPLDFASPHMLQYNIPYFH